MINKLTSAAEIPLTTDRGLPEIRISAMQSLVIEPHRGIRSFSDDSIMVETGGGIIHISGKEMVLKRMTLRELHLKGIIRAVELIEGHAN